ncbi:MAG: alpha/beta hydrolase family protein [bacterium]
MLAAVACTPAGADSLPPLKDGQPPRNLAELWAGYDPTAEPIEARTIRRWRDGPIVCRYVTYTIGTFKGRKSTMAGFYAFPAQREGKLPALLHLHGGGQGAQLPMVTFAALNGYAALSINWGAKPLEGVGEDEPNTDWGALDATQDGHNTHYASMKPDEKTLDDIESPRNNNWFLLVLAGRRAITFLQRQPEVDPARIGVLGHSMGGKLTVDLAGIDARVKAAGPSCGGSGAAAEALAARPGTGLRSKDPWYLATIDDRAYIPRVECPILYCSPTNDFAGPLDSMFANWRRIGSQEVRYAISPHLNHRHEPEFAVCRFLWFERYLKGAPALPPTPRLSVRLDGPGGVPTATVEPYEPGQIVRVCLYYPVDPHVRTRFWRDGRARREGDAWVGRCPVMSAEQPLYVLANVYYPLDRTFRKHAYLNFDGVEHFAISSHMASFTPDDLQKAGVRATDQPSMLIDDFSRGWHDWYRLNWNNPVHWTATTRKLKDPKWRGEAGRNLLLDVKTDRPNTLVFRLELAAWGAYPELRETRYFAAKPLKGDGQWQTVTLLRQDLRPEKPDFPAVMPGWEYITQLTLAARGTRQRDGREEVVDAKWEGTRQFRDLRWAPCGRAPASGPSPPLEDDRQRRAP